MAATDPDAPGKVRGLPPLLLLLLLLLLRAGAVVVGLPEVLDVEPPQPARVEAARRPRPAAATRTEVRSLATGRAMGWGSPWVGWERVGVGVIRCGGRRWERGERPGRPGRRRTRSRWRRRWPGRRCWPSPTARSGSR